MTRVASSSPFPRAGRMRVRDSGGAAAASLRIPPGRRLSSASAAAVEFLDGFPGRSP